MKKNTTSKPVLQAPSFDEARILNIATSLMAINRWMELAEKELKTINKRLDILDQVVLNIPQEEK